MSRKLARITSYPSLKFTVPGRPIGKQRARVANGHAYTPLSTREFEARVAQYAAIALQGEDLPHFPKGIPVFLDLRVYIMKRRGVYPDLSNILKAVEDGMNKIAYQDDKQVAMIVAQMAFASHEDFEMCEITLAPMSSVQGPKLVPYSPF